MRTTCRKFKTQNCTVDIKLQRLYRYKFLPNNRLNLICTDSAIPVSVEPSRGRLARKFNPTSIASHTNRTRNVSYISQKRARCCALCKLSANLQKRSGVPCFKNVHVIGHELSWKRSIQAFYVPRDPNVFSRAVLTVKQRWRLRRIVQNLLFQQSRKGNCLR